MGARTLPSSRNFFNGGLRHENFRNSRSSTFQPEHQKPSPDVFRTCEFRFQCGGSDSENPTLLRQSHLKGQVPNSGGFFASTSGNAAPSPRLTHAPAQSCLACALPKAVPDEKSQG